MSSRTSPSRFPGEARLARGVGLHSLVVKIDEGQREDWGLHSLWVLLSKDPAALRMEVPADDVRRLRLCLEPRLRDVGAHFAPNLRVEPLVLHSGEGAAFDFFCSASEGSFCALCFAAASAAVQALEGVYLAGVDASLNGDGSLCDSCAPVTRGQLDPPMSCLPLDTHPRVAPSCRSKTGMVLFW